jgi:periplasmic protein TonB
MIEARAQRRRALETIAAGPQMAPGSRAADFSRRVSRGLGRALQRIETGDGRRAEGRDFLSEASLGAAIPMTERSQARDWPFWPCLGLSLALHVGLALPLLWGNAREFGATDRVTTAISVTIEASDILDAAEQSEATQAAEAPAAPPGELAAVPQAEPEKAEDAPPRSEAEEPVAEPPPPATTHQKAEVAKRSKDDAPQQGAEAERQKPQGEAAARDTPSQRGGGAAASAEALPRDTGVDPADDAKQAGRRSKQQRAQAAAGAGATGSRGAKASAGRVSASQGALQDYRGIVNAWMARNKPAHGGGRGDVVILVVLSPSGALISARVFASSGNPSLDQIALAAARRSSPFPKPPAGSTAGQLRFTFPYRFR